MQAIFFEIPIEFPVVVASDVHSRENNAEHTLVEAVVALVGPVRRDAFAIAHAADYLPGNMTAGNEATGG